MSGKITIKDLLKQMQKNIDLKFENTDRQVGDIKENLPFIIGKAMNNHTHSYVHVGWKTVGAIAGIFGAIGATLWDIFRKHVLGG